VTYLLISLPFLAAAVAIGLVGLPADPRARRRRWIGIGVATAALLLLTAVFDTLIIANGIVAYDDGHRVGLAIGLAPVEDFAYPLAGVLLVPAIWTIAHRWSRTRRGNRDGVR
jgi:lycopene cyclase domain-containing protein